MVSRPNHAVNGTTNGLVESSGGPRIVVAEPPPMDDAQAGTQQIKKILHSLQRRWKIALPIAVVLAAAGAAGGWFALIPKYRAAAYLRIDADNRPLIFQTADQSSDGARGFELYRNTQSQLLKTPFVLTAALRDESLQTVEEIREADNPVLWLQENLNVDFPGRGEIMEVSVESTSGSGSVAIVNSVVKAYMDEVVVHERNKRLQRLNNLENVYSEAEGKIRSKRSELKTLAEALGTGDSDSLTVAQQTALNQFGLMQEKLSDVQFRLMQAEGELEIGKMMQERLAERRQELAALDQDEAYEITAADIDDPEVRKLESEVDSLELELASYEASWGPQHPKIRSMKRQLEIKRSLLEKAQEKALAAAERQVENVQQQAASGQMVSSMDGKQTFDLAGLSAKIGVLRSQEKSLQAKVDELANETRQLGRSSIDVELMRSEIDSLEGVLARVGEEIERTSIELKTNSRVEILSEAEKPTPPSPKKRIAMAVALGGLGWFLPFGLFAAWDLSRKEVTDLESVNSSLALSTLGTIPIVSRDVLKPHGRRFSKRLSRQSVELHESADATAVMLMHRAAETGKRVFMVSSAMPGEGKSTVACQLSQSIAAAGRKVALVDFDSRRPSIHRQFDMDVSPGVGEVLAADIDWPAAEHYVGEWLSVFTAGTRIRTLKAHCASGAVTDFLESLKENFDIVIIDSCPVLPVVDTRLIAKYMDGVVMTMVRDHSRLPLAANACELLKAHGAHVIGAVVIGTPSGGYPSHYYYAAEYADPVPPPVQRHGQEKGSKKSSKQRRLLKE